MHSTWVVLDLNLGVFCPLVVKIKLIKFWECANYVQISANKVQNEVLIVIFLVSLVCDLGAIRHKFGHFLDLTRDLMQLVT